MTPFDWEKHLHPASSLRPLRIQTWDDPEEIEPSFWTSERYGLFLLICSLVAAILIGYWWGGA